MRPPAYSTFGLTLVVNHACNLRCDYCYTGAKFHEPMPIDLGEQAVQRALASVKLGGTLRVAFFGGEPLLESARIREWMRTTRRAAQLQGKKVRFAITTNGTIANTPNAHALLMAPDVELAVSCDGTPARHDRHRRNAEGRGSYALVEATLRALVEARRPFTVVTVVRPDTLADLPAGLSHLRALGVTRFSLSLDVWTAWTEADIANLAHAVDAVADLWHDWSPAVCIDWFDTRGAALARPDGDDTRCAFGEGEVAVAPSGRLYPCERLVGEDRPGHPLQLPDTWATSDDFLELKSPRLDPDASNADGRGCRCSNYVRTGTTQREDALLRALDQAVHHALQRLTA